MTLKDVHPLNSKTYVRNFEDIIKVMDLEMGKKLFWL